MRPLCNGLSAKPSLQWILGEISVPVKDNERAFGDVVQVRRIELSSPQGLGNPVSQVLPQRFRSPSAL